MTIIPVILSGGSGTRLWPLSRQERPKQFLNLSGKNSMLQETISRLVGIPNLIDPIVVCNNKHRFLVASQCQEIGCKPNIILEPEGRNTAPAITVSALLASKKKDSIMLVLSADHLIKDIEQFQKSINLAIKYAQENKIITFGVKPTEPNTGYGYIKISDKKSISKVDKFIEKPDYSFAKNFIKTGGYLWNSGIFMFKTDYFLEQMSAFAPEVLKYSLSSMLNSEVDLDFVRLDAKYFCQCPSISIDYALMERSNNVYSVLLESDWSDVGSWNSLRKSKKEDKDGNVIIGDVIQLDTQNTYIHSTHKLVTTIGLKDLIIVNTKDALFISDNSSSEKVNLIVDELKNNSRTEHLFHRKVHRPWGWFDIIETGNFFQVKRLHLHGKSRLSLQYHNYRSEHWVLISGSVYATKGNKIVQMTEGDSIYIPIGEKHSLENKSDTYAEIIEVQSGKYLAEDDIIRIEDDYGRAQK